LDKAARKRSKQTNSSLNAVLLDILHRGLGLYENPPEYHDMDDLIGTWVDDPTIDAVLEEFDQIDEDLWK
jgi:hypothetical protein